jgi:hypothetical protein
MILWEILAALAASRTAMGCGDEIDSEAHGDAAVLLDPTSSVPPGGCEHNASIAAGWAALTGDAPALRQVLAVSPSCVDSEFLLPPELQYRHLPYNSYVSLLEAAAISGQRSVLRVLAAARVTWNASTSRLQECFDVNTRGPRAAVLAAHHGHASFLVDLLQLAGDSIDMDHTLSCLVRLRAHWNLGTVEAFCDVGAHVWFDTLLGAALDAPEHGPQAFESLQRLCDCGGDAHTQQSGWYAGGVYNDTPTSVVELVGAAMSKDNAEHIRLMELLETQCTGYPAWRYVPVQASRFAHELAGELDDVIPVRSHPEQVATAVAAVIFALLASWGVVARWQGSTQS